MTVFLETYFYRTAKSVLQIPLHILLHANAAWTERTLRLTGGMKHCLADVTPGGAVKLKREDDVVGVADLTYEAPLGAKVTAVHVLGPKLNQRLQVRFVVPICYLLQVQYTV